MTMERIVLVAVAIAAKPFCNCRQYGMDSLYDSVSSLCIKAAIVQADHHARKKSHFGE
jgi:hypothetical protein